MARRFIFIGIAAFWVVMMVLLWRRDFAGSSQLGTAVPVERVWHKILTAPDASGLEIYHRGTKVGYCRWSSKAGEDAASRTLAEDFRPGELSGPTPHYILELDGSVSLGGTTNPTRFTLNIQLSPEQNWEHVDFRANMRPWSWQLAANSGAQTVDLTIDDGEAVSEQSFTFADLHNPADLLRELGAPGLATVIGALGILPQTTSPAGKPSLGLEWTARNDTMRFGKSQVRVYRLETKLLGRFKVFVFVSRIGEILWVHLPDEWVLKHDSFAHF